MKRHELEHIIRADGVIAQSEEIYIIGRQAILGSFPSLPDERWKLIYGRKIVQKKPI